MSMTNCRKLFPAAFGIFLFGTLCAGELQLFAAENGGRPRLESPMSLSDSVPKKWGGKGVRVTPEKNGYLLELGGTDTYPGFALYPSKSPYWDFSKWTLLSADVENLDTEGQTDLHGRIYTRSPDGKEIRGIYNTVTLNPGEKRTLRIPFRRVDPSSPIRLEKLRSGPAGTPMPLNIYPERTYSISFYSRAPFLYARNGKARLRITNIRFEKPAEPFTEPIRDPERFYPFIDRFGQYKHGSWPEKIHSEADMKKQLAAESVQLKSTPDIPDRNQYGGWLSGPRHKATGFFRTEKVNGKWFLVDPEGCLYLSNGMNGVHFRNGAYTNNREHWFETKLKKPGYIDFVDLNLKKKYGSPLYPNVHERAALRLKKWGVNTIGAWSDVKLYPMRKMPYSIILCDWSTKGFINPLGFYDAFDPEFEKSIGEQMTMRYPWALQDPWCIGFFVNNELKYGDPWKFAEGILKEKKIRSAKREFQKRLKEKYHTVETLNRAWNSDYRSWDDFLASPKSFEKKNPAMIRDLTDFTNAMIEEYYKVCRRAVKRHAPNHLYLGARLRGSSDMRRPDLLPISAKYCDVISVNNYVNSIAHITVPAGIPDKPFLIGEYSFQVFSRGLFNNSLSAAGETQQDRAEALKRFWQGLLTNPNYVGAHWFYYRDQFLTGRSDGENFPFGFVDGCDVPYPELTEMNRKISENMYRYRMNHTLTDAMWK